MIKTLAITPLFALHMLEESGSPGALRSRIADSKTQHIHP